MTAAAFREAAQICRDVAEKDCRPRELWSHANGAKLCARLLEMRADAFERDESAGREAGK